MKKIISLIVLVAMFFSVLPTGVLAEDGDVILKLSGSADLTYGGKLTFGEALPVENAINGTTSGNPMALSKDGDELPWLVLDLGTPKELTEIIIYSRPSHDDLAGFSAVLEVSNDISFSDSYVISDSVTGAKGKVENFTLTDGEKYQYVRVMSKASVLCFAEIEVYGKMEIGTNLINKDQTKVTSHGTPYNESFGAENGIDGVSTSHVYLKGSSSDLPWVVLDLRIPSQLTKIALTARKTTYDWDFDVKIEVSNDKDFLDSKVVVSNMSNTVSGETVSQIIVDSQSYRYVRITSNAANLKFADVEIYGFCTPPELELTEVKSGDILLNDGDTVPKGIDSIELSFTTGFSSSALSDVNFLVNGNEHPALYNINAGELVDGKITINITKALSDGDVITLSSDSLTDSFGDSISFEYTYIVGGEDKGKGSIELSELEKSTTDLGERITVSGKTKSSVGVGISGRRVDLYVVAPDGSGKEIVADTMLSEDDGKFSFVYDLLDASHDSGKYVFSVGGEYIEDNAEKEHVFMSAGEELIVLEKLSGEVPEGTEPVQYIHDIFKEYGTKLGIELVENRNVISDVSALYNHFVGKDTYADKESLSAAYEQYVSLEIANQATDVDTIKALLNSTDDCERLCIDSGRLALVSEESFDIVADGVLDLEPFAEPADCGLAVNELVEAALAAECNKTDIDVVDSSAEYYKGQSAVVELAFTAEQTGVASAVFEITPSYASAMDNYSISADVPYEKSVKDGVLTVELKPERPIEKVTKLGSVAFSVPEEDSQDYTVAIKGRIEYRVIHNDKTISVYTNIKPKTSSVSFKEPVSSNGGSNSSNSSSGSSGFGGGNVTVKEPEPIVSKPDTFIDMNTAPWAKEAVEELFERGVISESPDGKFNPDRMVTREEFVKMIVMTMGLYDESAKSSFADVNPQSWYAPYVASAANSGIVSGTGNNCFGVGSNITRQDMAVIIHRTAGFGLSVGAPMNEFEDTSDISPYALEAVYTLKHLQIINGVSETQFNPKGVATRAMAAKVIYEMLKVLEVKKW